MLYVLRSRLYLLTYTEKQKCLRFFLFFSLNNSKGPTKIILTITITETLQHVLHPGIDFLPADILWQNSNQKREILKIRAQEDLRNNYLQLKTLRYLLLDV